MKRPLRWLPAFVMVVVAHGALLQPRTPPPVPHPAPPGVVTVMPQRVTVPAATQQAVPRPATPRVRKTSNAPPRIDAGPRTFVMPGPVVLWYQSRQGAVSADMRLTWTPGPGRYLLALETIGADGASATWLRSQGGLVPDGLLPTRHTAKPYRRSEQALTILREQAATEVASSAHEQRQPALSGVQDALSWLPQWLGHWMATGRSVPLQVAQTDGRIGWLMLAPDPGDPWHWSSTASAAQDDTVELWLSPDPPHWPLGWRRVTPWGQVTEWTALTPPHEASAPFEPP